MIGEKAPGFTLKNTSKEAISLSDYKGKTVIIAFYPGAFTGVCDKEMCSFQENLATLNQAKSTVVGISVDSPWANAEFARKYNLDNAKFVGLGGIEGYISANRVVVVIDNKGIIQHHWVAENPGIEPDYAAIVALAETL